MSKGVPKKSFMKKWWGQLVHEPTTLTSLTQLLKQAVTHKVLDDDALSMIEGVISVSKRQVRDIMVPRSQMVVVELNQPADVFLPVIIEAAHSRFPVIDEDADDVVGILLAKDLLKQVLKNPKLVLVKEMLRPPLFVPESKRLDALLKEFKNSRNHLALVVDEYGGVSGLVTIEDVLEEIVGDIEDEFDATGEKWISPGTGNAYLVKALTPIEELNEFFHTNYSEDIADTVGGLVTLHVGQLPAVSDEFQIGELKFTVVEMDRRRVGLLSVERLSPDKALSHVG